MENNIPVDLILSLSKDEVLAQTSAQATSWFDRLTMRSLQSWCVAA
jgi:hypothetical protein